MTDVERRVRRALAGDRALVHSRTVDLDDIRILTRAQGGDGRTVAAYAAVFNKPVPIRDQDGYYREQIAPAAFNKTIRDRADKIQVFYNHAKTIQGQPSDLFSLPLGVPVPGAMRADSRGWYTETRYSKTDIGDWVLELIKDGAIRGQSFTGAFLKSDPEPPYYGRSADDLQLVTRMEIAALEYGPTPFPAYQDAEIVGVRNRKLMGDQQRDAGPAPYTQQAAENVQCPACGLFNMPDAVFCDQCGNQLPPSAFPDGPQDYAQTGPDECLCCPNCQRMNDMDASFCDQCGQAIPAIAYADPDMDGDAAEDMDGDGDGGWTGDDAGRAALMQHFGMSAEEVAALPDADRSLLAASLDGHTHDGGQHDRAAVDNSAWDGSKAWHNGSASPDPAAFFRGICAGEKTVGDPKTQAHWALPHHYHPSDPPNAEGVSAALGRVDQTDDLVSKTAAEAHLQAHKNAINAASGSGSSGSRSGNTDTATAGSTTDDETGQSTADTAAAPDGQPEPPDTHSANEGHTEPPDTHSATDEPSNSRSGTMEDRRLTVEERVARQSDIRARLAEIDTEYAGAALDDTARSEWTSLQNELIENDNAIRDATSRAAYLRTLAQNPDATIPGTDPGSGYSDAQAGQRGDAVPAGGQARSAADDIRTGRGSGQTASRFSTRPGLSQRIGNLWDLTEVRQNARSIDELPALYRDRAMIALENATFPGDRMQSREQIQGNIARLLEYNDDKEGSLAKRMLITGSPLYHRAFSKAVAALSTNGLSTEESRALAMGTPASWSPGSYPVPYQLDPSVTLTSNGAINPLRQISRVEQIVGKEWLGVTSAGIVVTRTPEATEATDEAPVLTQPGVAPTRVQAFVPFSVEVEQDWNGLMAEIAMMLADAKDIEEATTFITGAGTGDIPGGVVATQGTAQYVYTAATATTATGDIYNVEDNMAPRFRPQASWLASKTGYNAIRQLFAQFASAAGDAWVRPSAGTAPELLGYGAYEASAMDTSTTTSGKQPLLMGDFNQYLIVDRIGMSIELVPHLFGTTSNFPTGQRGIFALWRNSATILVPNAFRLLTVR